MPVAAFFEDLQEAEDVRRDVRVGSLERVPHAGLGGEVNDALEVAAVEELVHRFGIGERRPHEFELTMRLEPFQARFLDPHVVILIDGVEPNDIVAVRQQSIRDVETDEARGAGDENPHERDLC